MNRQEVFNRVYKHLLTQGVKAEVRGGSRYRAPGGLKCAIGILIPDELYTPDLEDKTPTAAVVHVVLEKALGESLSTEDVQFLNDLQIIHDLTPPEDWEAELKHFAADNELEVPNSIN